MSRQRTRGGIAVLLLGLGVALTSAAGAAPPAEQDYALQCRGCHGAEGRGLAGRVPALQGLGRFLTVPEGRSYLVRVPGVAQASLDDARLAALLNWVLLRFGDTEAAPPYDAAEVGRLRARPLRDAAAARGELMRRLDGGLP